MRRVRITAETAGRSSVRPLSDQEVEKFLYRYLYNDKPMVECTILHFTNYTFLEHYYS